MNLDPPTINVIQREADNLHQNDRTVISSECFAAISAKTVRFIKANAENLIGKYYTKTICVQRDG